MSADGWSKIGRGVWVAPIGTPVPMYDINKPRSIRKAECRRDGHEWAQVAVDEVALGFHCQWCDELIRTGFDHRMTVTPPPRMRGLSPFTAAVELAAWRGLFSIRGAR